MKKIKSITFLDKITITDKTSFPIKISTTFSYIGTGEPTQTFNIPEIEIILEETNEE